jgi:hypothetical protein
VDRSLGRFVKDPKGLRSQLAKHNSLISGEFALQFLAQGNWQVFDLDIFLDVGIALHDFSNYLLANDYDQVDDDGNSDPKYATEECTVRLRFPICHHLSG